MALVHVLSSIPPTQKVIIYTDNESAANTVNEIKERVYQQAASDKKSVIEKKKKEHNEDYRARKRIEICLRTRKAAFSDSRTTAIEHVYSHLIDTTHSVHSTDIKSQEYERKIKIMRERYGDRVQHILLGNKEADALANAARTTYPTSKHIAFSNIDDEFVVVDTRAHQAETVVADARRFIAPLLKEKEIEEHEQYII